MSLNISMLKSVRELGGGVVQAQCPACAEAGRDKKGEHLRIYPDGRFGCCVYPRDREHRKRIFALAGDREVRQFSVKVPRETKKPDTSITHLLQDKPTSGTPVCNSEIKPEKPKNEFGTSRTGIFNPYAYELENVTKGRAYIIRT